MLELLSGIEWKVLYKDFKEKRFQRVVGGEELDKKRADEVAGKLKSLADELESGGSSNHSDLDFKLRKLYNDLPYCSYRDVVICAGYWNEKCMGGKKCQQELMKVLRMQMY